MKIHNYIKCNRCSHWDIEYKRKAICSHCNNTGEIIDPKEILCNMCGESMYHEIKTSSGLWKTDEPNGLYNATVSGGYDSYHLLDMNRYTFSICEKCLRQLFIQFKIKPIVVETNADDCSQEESWKQDQESYEFRVWKDEGKHHQAYLNRKCNFIKDCSNTAEYTQLISNDFTENCCCENHKNLWTYSNSKLTKFIPNVLKPFL